MYLLPQKFHSSANERKTFIRERNSRLTAEKFETPAFNHSPQSCFRLSLPPWYIIISVIAEMQWCLIKWMLVLHKKDEQRKEES